MRGLVLTVAVLAAGVAHGQTVPTGGKGYFGAPADQAFTPGTAFPPSVAPAPAPVVPAVGAGADGGLLPSPPPKIWSGTADVGLNGATGNSELFNLTIGYTAVRKTADNIFTNNFLYTNATQNGVTTADQALFNARDEVLFAGSPWTLFGSTNIEYDQLRAYRFLIGVYAGVGYIVADEKDLTLKLRAGAGAVRQVGRDGTVSRWVPELVFGYDFRYAWNDRSSFVSTLDFYPRVDDFGQFRVRARAAYEYILDPEMGMILRLGAQDRYDSNPGNAKRNDLTYFATWGLKF